ncbi:NAD(+)/NADH kinase [Archaeoglobus profundus]|uniref:NAD kinase n=1 Tax=Archaeoglobus profundus (strain DSM 5631 / JCM 9629 / NBRC 100127 / Av18) TaxID=572546 RepID=D2REP1_ARCPA|nr:NAD(+)/NADH kinase [Archaeoglobus profundus]ADB58585.1 ATP-NAD/AcoX kinase [Archaeoglobus profundus DSM 5631]
MKGAIVYKPDSKDLAEEVREFVNANGFHAEVVSKSKDLEQYDYIIVIGGDGTILRVLQSVKNCPPIFAINTGRVGLLTHCEPYEYKDVLIKALNSFEVEEFMRLSCVVDGNEVLALNEFAVLCSVPAKLVEMTVYVDDVKVESLRCDGMLVSTPIGSTAYALSTGGPIIDPYLNSILIVPVAPFKLGWKPWVVKDDRVIRLEFDRSVFIVADGQKRFKHEQSVEITKSNHPARFFKISHRLKRTVEKLRNIC